MFLAYNLHIHSLKNQYRHVRIPERPFIYVCDISQIECFMVALTSIHPSITSMPDFHASERPIYTRDMHMKKLWRRGTIKCVPDKAAFEDTS